MTFDIWGRFRDALQYIQNILAHESALTLSRTRLLPCTFNSMWPPAVTQETLAVKNNRYGFTTPPFAPHHHYLHLQAISSAVNRTMNMSSRPKEKTTSFKRAESPAKSQIILSSVSFFFFFSKEAPFHNDCEQLSGGCENVLLGYFATWRADQLCVQQRLCRD